MAEACGMTSAVDTGRGGDVRGLRPLYECLESSVDERLDEHESSGPKGIGATLLVVEQFPDLLARARWLEERARTRFGLDRMAFEAVVALCAMQLAARRAGASGADDPAPPDWVTAAFLTFWRPCLIRTPDVTAPQVATACLGGGGWYPRHGSEFDLPSWEPARLGVMTMTFKAVNHGLHALANKGVTPLVRERCEQRDVFAHRVHAGTQAIALSLVSPQPGECGRSIAAWACEVATLWGFLFDLILGPGHPGGGGIGGRPLPGAFAKSLLGGWLEPTLGITVKTVEQYFCSSCNKPHPGPGCPVSPSALVMATSRRNHYVTPKDRLSGCDHTWGHEEARRNICKSDVCLEELRQLLSACGRRPAIDQQPLYHERLEACPYCGEPPTRWHKTVWTRHP